jgi:site-specific DNA recombinase
VSAPALESAVVEQIRWIGHNPTMLGAVMRQIAERTNARSAELALERDQIQSALQTLSQEMSALARTVSSPGPEAKAATDRLAETHERAAELNRQLTELQQTEAAADLRGVNADELQRALANFSPLWEHMTSWEQEKFIRALVEEVRYDGTAGVVTVGFRSTGIKELCQHDAGQPA